MALSAVEAHLLCAALVAADIVARTLRLRAVLAASGQTVPLRRIVGTNLAGDAGAALTPYRLGGDVARLLGLRRAGVATRTAAGAIVSEAMQTWPVVLLVGGLLAWLYGAAWWATLAARVSQLGLVPLGAIVSSLAVVAFAAAPRVRRALDRHRVGTLAGAVEAVRISPRTLAYTLPLTAISVGARVCVLPVLASAIAPGTPIGQLLFGSFALLHGPLVLPTPAGAGAVEIGLLASLKGAAHAGRLLLAWRLYTSGIGIVSGVGVMLAAYARSRLRRRRRTQPRRLTDVAGSRDNRTCCSPSCSRRPSEAALPLSTGSHSRRASTSPTFLRP